MVEQLEQPLDGLNLVANWHDTDNSNFVTLIIDLAQKKIHSSALLYYGSENEVESFAKAAISQVSRSG